MSQEHSGVLLDTSAVLALVFRESGWEQLAAIIAERQPFAAETLAIEVGNALSKHYRRALLSADEVAELWDVFEALAPAIILAPVNVRAALVYITKRRMWAYDAYVVEAAVAAGLPLLTRDRHQAGIAILHGVKIL